MFFCLAVVFIKTDLLGIERNFIDRILLAICVITFLIGCFIGLLNLTRTLPLEGKLDGFLVFEFESILVDENVFSLEKIKKIEIKNDDYNGKFVGNRGNFNPARSNGTDNFLTLKLYSGETKKYQFELYEANDFQKVRKQLIHYYLNGKIDFSVLAYVLGEKSKNEIKELKNEIEQIGTNHQQRN